MNESNKEEIGYPEVCTYTVKSDDDYEDYQEGRFDVLLFTTDIH